MDALSFARRLLFPSPVPSYDFDSRPEETVWIPFNARAAEDAVEAAVAAQRSAAVRQQRQRREPRDRADDVVKEATSEPSSASASSTPPSSASASASASPSGRSASPLSAAAASSPAPASGGGCSELPAFFLPFQGASLLVVHAHGNGIDIGGMHAMVRFYQRHLRCHFLLFEYAGYGVCEGEPSEDSLNAGLWSTLSFVVDVLCWPLSRVVLFGQSIGSGPCCWAASWLNRAGRHLAGVVLQSPFTSVRAIVRDLVGSAAASLVAERWNSLDGCVQWMTDPVLFLHGARDELISCAHSERLFERCASVHKHILLLPDATHNEFHLHRDVIAPIQQFLDLYTRIADRQRHSRPSAAEDAKQPSSASPPSPSHSAASDASIRALLARSKRAPQRTTDGAECAEEFLRGNAGEPIPLELSVPRRFTTVPASAIAYSLRRAEARRRDEEAKSRAKERKDFVAALWERGKQSLLSWNRAPAQSPSAAPQRPPLSAARSPPAPASASAPTPSPTSASSSSPSSSATRPSSRRPLATAAQPFHAVSLPTAVPVPPPTPLPPPTVATAAPAGRPSALSGLSICVATAVAAALVQSASAGDPSSYSSPRARREAERASPSPSPSPASHQQSASQSQSQSHSHSQYVQHGAPHSPELGIDDDDDGSADHADGAHTAHAGGLLSADEEAEAADCREEAAQSSGEPQPTGGQSDP